MSRIRSQNTVPEKAVRSLLHRLGYRFRLHVRGLPGRPDIVLRKHRVAIFVHGCFWHRHPGCRDAATPGTRVAWWHAKLTGNVERDKAVCASLSDAGWRVLIVWECELRDVEAVAVRLEGFLRGAVPYSEGTVHPRGAAGSPDARATG